MILILDNYVLPNIKSDLSDLVYSYVHNVCGTYDVYHNAVVDKYEMSKHWKVPFIDFVGSSSNGDLDVKIGTYDFESIKRGINLIHVDSHSSTLYNFVGCPRHEHPIHFYDFGLQYYFLEKVEAVYKNLGNYKSQRNYYEEEFTNELVSFVFKFKKNDFNFEINSDDLIHRLVNYDINKYEYRKTDYKIDVYFCSKGWYDYGEARSVFNLIDILRKIDTLTNNGLKIQNIDFNTFGMQFLNGQIADRFMGFYNSDDFISSIAFSTVQESNGFNILEFNNKLSSKFIPYYRFLFENILNTKIEKTDSNALFMRIEKDKFVEKESIIPYLIFNVMRNIENDSDYMKFVHTIRIESDLQYAKLINYKEPTNCFSYELRLKDILKMEATDVYDVLYRTGDRDDIWWRKKHIKFTFDCEFDSATIYAIKQAIPGIVQTGNAFEYKEEESGESARILVGYRKDFSKEYKSKTIVCLCNTMYSIYKSGVWDF